MLLGTLGHADLSS